MYCKKVGLIILDGVGLNPNTRGNALLHANCPNIDYLTQYLPMCALQASGTAVGLPEGQVGNSEIGHLNIGAGRTIYSELVRIDNDLNHNQFVYNPNLHKVFALVKHKNAKLHIIGLTSFGGVHSKLTHMLRVLEECGVNNIKTVVHCIGDGRDTDVHDFVRDMKYVTEICQKYPHVQIGTVSGRYYGMDRDQHWDRCQKMIDAMLHKGPTFEDPSQYIADSYFQDKTDEFIIPGYSKVEDNNIISKDDIVFFINFRQDRTRQLCHLFKKSKLYQQTSPLWDLNLTLVTMVKYDGIDSDIVIYPPQNYPNTLGKVIADAGLRQLRIAETEKYAHVTFFLDGGKEVDYPNEKKILVKSPNVATYDLKPEMSANEVTEQLINNMHKFDFFVCNYANCDMVGHTGKWEPTIKAIETVDACLAKVVRKAKELGFTLFFTSDHGNCDYMIDDQNKPVTTHSIYPTFLTCTDRMLTLRDGALNNIAPTILKYLEIPIPKDMNRKPLF